MASAHLEDAESLDLPSRKARAGKSFGEEFPVDRSVGPKKLRKKPRVGGDGRVLSGAADFLAIGNRDASSAARRACFIWASSGAPLASIPCSLLLRNYFRRCPTGIIRFTDGLRTCQSARQLCLSAICRNAGVRNGSKGQRPDLDSW